MAKPMQIKEKGVSPYYENLAKRFNAGDPTLTKEELNFLSQMTSNPKLYNGNNPLTMDHVKANANKNNKLNAIQKTVNAENTYKPNFTTEGKPYSNDFVLEGKPYSKDVGPYRGSIAVSTTNNANTDSTNTKLPSATDTGASSTSAKSTTSWLNKPIGNRFGNVFKGALSNPMGIPVIASAIDNVVLDPFRDKKSKNVADADYILKNWQENLGIDPDGTLAKFGRGVTSTVVGKTADYGRDALQMAMNGMGDLAKLGGFGLYSLGNWAGLVDDETMRRHMLAMDEYIDENNGDAFVKEYFGDKYLPEDSKATNGVEFTTNDAVNTANYGARAFPRLPSLPPTTNTQNKEVANANTNTTNNTNTKTPISVDEAINNILTKGINGPDRIKYLQSLGLNPAEVQQRINAMMRAQSRVQPTTQPTTMQQVQQVLNREAMGMPSYLPNDNQPIVNTNMNQPLEINSWDIGNNASLPSAVRDMYNNAIRNGMSPREAEMYIRGLM